MTTAVDVGDPLSQMFAPLCPTLPIAGWMYPNMYTAIWGECVPEEDRAKVAAAGRSGKLDTVPLEAMQAIVRSLESSLVEAYKRRAGADESFRTELLATSGRNIVYEGKESVINVVNVVRAARALVEANENELRVQSKKQAEIMADWDRYRAYKKLVHALRSGNSSVEDYKAAATTLQDIKKINDDPELKYDSMDYNTFVKQREEGKVRPAAVLNPETNLALLARKLHMQDYKRARQDQRLLACVQQYADNPDIANEIATEHPEKGVCIWRFLMDKVGHLLEAGAITMPEPAVTVPSDQEMKDASKYMPPIPSVGERINIFLQANGTDVLKEASGGESVQLTVTENAVEPSGPPPPIGVALGQDVVIHPDPYVVTEDSLLSPDSAFEYREPDHDVVFGSPIAFAMARAFYELCAFPDKLMDEILSTPATQLYTDLSKLEFCISLMLFKAADRMLSPQIQNPAYPQIKALLCSTKGRPIVFNNTFDNIMGEVGGVHSYNSYGLVLMTIRDFVLKSQCDAVNPAPTNNEWVDIVQKNPAVHEFFTMRLKDIVYQLAFVTMLSEPTPANPRMPRTCSDKTAMIVVKSQPCSILHYNKSLYKDIPSAVSEEIKSVLGELKTSHGISVAFDAGAMRHVYLYIVALIVTLLAAYAKDESATIKDLLAEARQSLGEGVTEDTTARAFVRISSLFKTIFGKKPYSFTMDTLTAVCRMLTNDPSYSPKEHADLAEGDSLIAVLKPVPFADDAVRSAAVAAVRDIFADQSRHGRIAFFATLT